MMKYLHTEEPVQAAADHLAIAIRTHLEQGERVVWLLSGGSGIKVDLAVARQLTGENLDNLFVTLTDERYGTPGHPDENWHQLLEQGFSLADATTLRPLNGSDRQQTTDTFNTWLEEQLTAADFSIGLFGIGSDGHTAGIKPHSSAVTAAGYAYGYTGEDFERITMTPAAIQHLDEAVVQASGGDKATTLRHLLADNLPLDEQPAQILKKLPLVTIYSDNKLQLTEAPTNE